MDVVLVCFSVAEFLNLVALLPGTACNIMQETSKTASKILPRLANCQVPGLPPHFPTSTKMVYVGLPVYAV